MHFSKTIVGSAGGSPQGFATPSFDAARFDHLNDQQILERIGGLLARALVRSGTLARSVPDEASATAGARATAIDPITLIRDPMARQIALFLKVAGPATPVQLATALGIKRRTLVRKLDLLRQSGLCSVIGKTRAARYEFRTEFACN